MTNHAKLTWIPHYNNKKVINNEQLTGRVACFVYNPFYCDISARRSMSSIDFPLHLQDIVRNINIFCDLSQFVSYVIPIDGDIFIFQVRRLEREFFQYSFQYSIQTARTDVFRFCIHSRGNLVRLPSLEERYIDE